MNAKLRFFIFLLICSGTIYVLNNPMGQVPPLGKFLDPFKGVWQNALVPAIPKSSTLKMPDLKDEVQIVFNERGVPHIFAQNDHDLCFAAGYVMAMHRLWQMEFSSHAALGRTSEILGERALEFDRYIRKMGMSYAAEKMVEAISEDHITNDQLNAYSAGINAWIKSLSPGKYPFEYKLLGHKPEPWSQVKTAAMGMNMNRTLTFANSGLRLSALKAKWGEDAVVAFYDSPPKYNEPILSRKDWDFSLTPPASPGVDFMPQFILDAIIPDREPGIGSNNWVVSGKLTQSGAPILASDPHLNTTLPSIWYEMQLNAPGVNVYGVTIPGMGPGVGIGFNEKIAWGITNTHNEVLNIFEVELDEAETHYFFDQKWVPLTYRHEIYKVRGGKTVIDSIPFTHHGPLMYRPGETPFSPTIPIAHAISWAALETGNSFIAYFLMNRSGNFTEFRNAVSHMKAPSQNFGFASVGGDIAKQLNGLWPLQWEHQGMFISDGRRPEYDWKGYIPFEYLPYEVNPARGFVSNANQKVAYNYPFYIGWLFGNTARPNIINRKLSENKKFTVDDMKELQLNNDNFWAQTYLDQMLDSVMAWYSKNTMPGEPSPETKALRYLRDWNRVNEPESIATTVFERWRTEMSSLLWKPFVEPVSQFSPIRPYPDITFMVLFHDYPADVYRQLFGNLPATAELLAQSFKNTLAALEAERGKELDNWQWWKINGLTLNHLLNIQALNHPRIKVGGSGDSPNAIRGSHAPSWRMVVSLGDTIQAWGIYPGGQSGNPAIRGYNAFVNDYAEGNYYSLKLFSTFEIAASENKNIMTLKPR